MGSHILKIFISPGCYGCRRAQELAQWVQAAEPRLEVHIVDLAGEPDADMGAVFAVPTYLYNGKPLFLGNPSPQELLNWLANLDLEA